jgi:hypothetical protein
MSNELTVSDHHRSRASSGNQWWDSQHCTEKKKIPKTKIKSAIEQKQKLK